MIFWIIERHSSQCSPGQELLSIQERMDREWIQNRLINLDLLVITSIVALPVAIFHFERREPDYYLKNNYLEGYGLKQTIVDLVA